MSNDSHYTEVTSGPVMAGDQAKKNAATFWEDVCPEAAGTLIENYHFWQFRRRKTDAPVEPEPEPEPVNSHAALLAERDELRAALERLSLCPDVMTDSLESETVKALNQARAALAEHR